MDDDMNQDHTDDREHEHGEEERRERVLRYLYQTMTPAERTAFEIDVERDPVLNELLETERSFDAAVPPGSGTRISDAELAGARTGLRAALDAEAGRGESLLDRLARWWRSFDVAPSPAAALGMACAAVVLLMAGVLIGRTTMQPVVAVSPGSAAGLVDAGGLHVTDLRVSAYEPETGRVALSFDAVSSGDIEGNVRDAAIRQLLTDALENGMRPAARLRTVELLGAQPADDPAREALIHALLHDENPGVRLGAITALKELAANDQVRAALRSALRDDANPGVRVQAVEVLRHYQEPATLEVLERTQQVDGNEYIRSEAGRAVEEWTAQTTDQL